MNENYCLDNEETFLFWIDLKVLNEYVNKQQTNNFMVIPIIRWWCLSSWNCTNGISSCFKTYPLIMDTSIAKCHQHIPSNSKTGNFLSHGPLDLQSRSFFNCTFEFFSQTNILVLWFSKFRNFFFRWPLGVMFLFCDTTFLSWWTPNMANCPKVQWKHLKSYRSKMIQHKQTDRKTYSYLPPQTL